MEQSKKRLKTMSIIVLVFAALSLVNIVFDVFLGALTNVEMPEGAPENTLLITQVVLVAVTCICLIPQVYVGFKGLKMAKNPDSSKAHIVWATILLVITVLGMLSPALSLIKAENVGDNASTLFSGLIDAIIFFEYIKYAKAVAKAE